MLGRLLRIDPHAHGIIAGAEDLHLPDALDPGEPILDVQGRIISQIGDVVIGPVRDEVDDHDEVGGALDGRDAESTDFRG